MAKRQLVVAKYREDVAWTNKLADFDMFIYDKGNPEAPLPLPNQGRESHTYLHHIVTHYDRLADITAFVQGHPFDHAPDALEQLGQLSSDHSFLALGDYLLVEDDDGMPNHPGLPLAAHYTQFMAAPAPEFFVCRSGACFAVNRAVIQRRPRDFYEQLLHYSLASPVHGYVLERLWTALFRSSPQSQGLVTAVDAHLFRDFQFMTESLRAVDGHPLVVFDLGLTNEQRTWCAAIPRTTIIPCPPINHHVARFRQQPMWQTWFKPFLLEMAPFDRVLWLDADCTVLEDLGGAFRLLDDRPLITPDVVEGVGRNLPRLYELLPIPGGQPYPLVEINAGVVGLCKTRDRVLLNTWLWGCQWAAVHPEHHPLIAWWDQGMLLWALHRTNNTAVVQMDNHRFNASAPRQPRLLDALGHGRNLLQAIRDFHPNAAVVHWFGDRKLSRALEREIELGFGTGSFGFPATANHRNGLLPSAVTAPPARGPKLRPCSYRTPFPFRPLTFLCSHPRVHAPGNLVNASICKICTYADGLEPSTPEKQHLPPVLRIGGVIQVGNDLAPPANTWASLLTQTLAPAEILLLDQSPLLDGRIRLEVAQLALASPIPVLTRVVASDPYPKLLWTTVLSATTADLLCPLRAGDVLDPHYFALGAREFHDPAIGLVYSDWEPHQQTNSRITAPHAASLASLQRQNYIHTAPLLRRQARSLPCHAAPTPLTSGFSPTTSFLPTMPPNFY